MPRRFNKEILRFYFITDEAASLPVADQIKAAIDGGATIIQYRNKSGAISRYKEALEAAIICKKRGVFFIINDDVLLAKAVGADGVHIGQNDDPPDVVREIMGEDAIIGISVSSLLEYKKTEIEYCDYLGAGPVFPTGTKTDASPAIGCSGLAAICEVSPLPVVAIGGITPEKAKQCIENGACGVCMISAISRAEDPLKAAFEFGSALGTVRNSEEFYVDENELLKDVLKRTPGHEDFSRIIKIQPGDDACLLDKIMRPVISTDSQIENVHFKLSWQSPFEIGRKAVSVCLSDLAASYARPLAIFLNLGIPEGFTKSKVRDLYSGIQDSLEKYGCGLGGGNITKSLVLSLELFAVGEGSDIFPLRSNAKPGYGVYLTGFTGLSRCGLLYNSIHQVNGLFDGGSIDSAFRNPRARFDAASVLEKYNVDCVMDISDGIAADVFRMAEASGITISLDPSGFPIHEEMQIFCDIYNLDSLKEAVQGGEDYELLFCCEEKVFGEIKKHLPSAFKVGKCGLFSGKRLENLPSGIKAFDHISGKPNY
ncbi:thiamine phosphate synthase [Desulforegula conservatrix]|uniref:thiamine phosphate synthase n=1 Tax=Desulforegula conservatrix TaxID=153026 RepID=UPI0003FD9ECB|nr:thiamine phosphate synthase [Desulforegula conservatrix]